MMPALFFGGNGGTLQRADSSYLDGDAPYEARLRPNPIRPAGIGGKCAFPTVYIALTFSAPFRVRVTPILDGIPYWDLAKDLRHLGSLTERDPPHIFRLSFRNLHIRNGKVTRKSKLVGSSFTIEISMPCPDTTEGDLIFEGIEVEYEVVSEAGAPG